MTPWMEQLRELELRRERSRNGGGPEKVARQHRAGKLTVRERIALLLDPGSFQELGSLATMQPGRAEPNPGFTAADGYVMGTGRIDGRLVAVGGEDFTVMGGSSGKVGGRKRTYLTKLAVQERMPLVFLLEGAGARTQESPGGSFPRNDMWNDFARVSGLVPMVAAIMGPTVGAPALLAPIADFSLMVKGTAMMAAGGPPLVERSIGERITKEDLGGSSVHCYESGVVHNEAASDEEALLLVRRYLSFFPSSAWESPPVRVPAGVPNCGSDAILGIVPERRNRAYDMRKVIRSIVDEDWLEIQPGYGRSLLTCLARIGGRPVGIVANQPLVLGGGIDGPAADKECHFVQVCTAFHLPIIFIMDVPGFMIGSKAEREGVLRRGLRVQHALAHCDVPTFCLVIRKAYGMGAVAMGGGHGLTMTLAWPSIEFGSLPVEGGVAAAYKTALAGVADGQAAQAELEQRLIALGGWGPAAGSFKIDEVIDPRETQERMIRFLEVAAARQSQQLGPAMHYGVMP